MEPIKRIDELNKETEIKLVKTDKILPESYQKIFYDVKNTVMDIAKRNDDKKGTKNKNEESMDESILLAGGSLSELFIEGYGDKPKDLDIFVTTDVQNDRSQRVNEELIKDLLNECVGDFEIEKREKIETSTYNTFLTITNIIKGKHKDYPELNIEIVFASLIRMNFDLSFREFYSDGKYIYATNKALEAIEKKEIHYVTSMTPLQSIFRAQEFAERYGYEINQENENLLYKMIVLYQRENPNILIDIFSATRKYKTQEKYNKVLERVKKVCFEQEEKDRLETLMFVEGIKEEMALAKSIERKKVWEQKGWNDKDIWTYKVPNAKNANSSFRHRETGERVTRDIYIKIQESEEKLRKEFDLKCVFKKPTVDEKEDMLRKLRYSAVEILGENDYYSAKINLETDYYLLKLDQCSMGVGDLNFLLQMEHFTSNYGQTEAEIKKSLLTEEVHFRIGEENKLWEMKNKYADEEKISYELEFSYDKNNETRWHKLEVDVQKGKAEIQISRDYMYLTPERRKVIAEMIEKTVSTIKNGTGFNYRPKEIASKYGSQMKRYTVATNQMIEKIIKKKEIEEETNKQTDYDLPF